MTSLATNEAVVDPFLFIFWIFPVVLRILPALIGCLLEMTSLATNEAVVNPLTHFPWQPQPHLFANRSDCVSFVQDGSNETDKFDWWKAKSCDPGQGRALETWRKSTQCSRATRRDRICLFSQHSWHLEDELGPIRLIIRPLISATLVRSEGGWYNRIRLHCHCSGMNEERCKLANTHGMSCPGWGCGWTWARWGRVVGPLWCSTRGTLAAAGRPSRRNGPSRRRHSSVPRRVAPGVEPAGIPNVGFFLFSIFFPVSFDYAAPFTLNCRHVSFDRVEYRLMLLIFEGGGVGWKPEVNLNRSKKRNHLI